MDFEKQAREILSKIEDDHQYKFSAYDALLEQALRAAYLAGKEDAAKWHDFMSAALEKEEELDKRSGLWPSQTRTQSIELHKKSADQIRSDPSQVKKEKV